MSAGRKYLGFQTSSGEQSEELRSFLRARSGQRKSLPAHLRLGTMIHDTPPPTTVKEPKPQDMPVKVLNGSPSYMHLLDALNSWQLAKELHNALDSPAAAAFNNVAPVGAAVAVTLSKVEAQQCQVEDMMPLKSLATAYARARAGDRATALGDFVAISETLDLQTAKIINRDMSEGIIAPDFEQPALELLCNKKQGTFIILKIDPTYKATENEERSVFGLKLKQKFQDCVITPRTFQDNIIAGDETISPEGQRDLTVATLALKYAPGHTLCYAKNGQVIGIGSGREDSANGPTHTASYRATNWWLRHHPRVLRFPFRPIVKRLDRYSVAEIFIASKSKPEFLANFDKPEKMFEKEVPKIFTDDERGTWLGKLKDVALSSDAFYPFPPDMDDLLALGVRWVATSGGRKSEAKLKEVCGEKGIVLTHSGLNSAVHSSSSSS